MVDGADDDVPISGKSFSAVTVLLYSTSAGETAAMKLD